MPLQAEEAVTATVWSWLEYIRTGRGDPREGDPEAVRAYNPFLVNRALSYDKGAVLSANRMNAYPLLDPEMAAAYYRGALRGPGRRTKWAKPVLDADAESVSRALGMGRSSARQALRCMTDAQLAELRTSMEGMK